MSKTLIISSVICTATTLSPSHNPVIANGKTVSSDVEDHLCFTLAQIFCPCPRLILLLLISFFLWPLLLTCLISHNHTLYFILPHLFDVRNICCSTSKSSTSKSVHISVLINPHVLLLLSLSASASASFTHICFFRIIYNLLQCHFGPVHCFSKSELTVKPVNTFCLLYV